MSLIIWFKVVFFRRKHASLSEGKHNNNQLKTYLVLVYICQGQRVTPVRIRITVFQLCSIPFFLGWVLAGGGVYQNRKSYLRPSHCTAVSSTWYVQSVVCSLPSTIRVPRGLLRVGRDKGRPSRAQNPRRLSNSNEVFCRGEYGVLWFAPWKKYPGGSSITQEPWVTPHHAFS